MGESKQAATRFFGYPRAVEAPVTPYKKKEDANPVFTGVLLLTGAWIVAKIQFLQRTLWANAGFNGLRELPYLKDYRERWDPTVIPISDCGCKSNTNGLDPKSFPILPEDMPGRYRSVAEYHALYLSGQLTPMAVVESLLPLIRREASPKSHHSIAFIDSNVDEIMKEARASTQRYKDGSSLGIMDGIPTAIKDETDVAGYRTRSGRKQNDKVFSLAEKSSWPVQTLRDAGGIILGKLNMHELGADTTNNNPNWGTPRNPHNDQYYTGGSSGGAAYVVSAGLVPFAIGADGGGSIRIPSSFCGIYGLKPSHNRLEDLGSTVTVSGPLAATVSDLEITYRIMAESDPSDPTCSLFTKPCAKPSAHRPKIIGIYKEWFERADPAVLKLCNEVITYYKEKLGYQVVEITIPYVPQGQLAHAFTILSEMAVRARAKPFDPSNWLAGLNPANQVLLAVGAQTPAQDYLLAQQLRNMLMQHLAFLYQKYPGLVIVTPTSPMAGWPIASEGDLKYGITDGNTSIRNMEYVWLANFCGNPAISCPVGYVEPKKGNGRVPVGIMAMGEWGSELGLLEWGRECEKWLNEVSPDGRQRPSNWEDVVVNAQGKMVS
ncbi:D-lactate ferricytochrome c oxidoreductase [Cadophora gregata]|uniref:D-lactate ferricytochrome c oxidoreductase n=1 Tax=Cadophora gregata TaxID=51156 RepID=UPI0026DD7001|nr:D-lactate ferricytochrome c oxidoreductase [Cadophora gregata]KAK0124170.1 D-lactate ferricytochrome c oxidoreductase [Cadophora gregata]KAK0130502.1 D-lactate ferricytochrome c oxidoreductase [Cadophora gregata f. sp. sojae]